MRDKDFGVARVLNLRCRHKPIRQKSDSINSFLWALFTVRPLEYDLLTECFLKLTYPYRIVEEDVKLMQNGSHQEVMERIEAGTLDDKALTALFFRNNPSEFEAYLDKWLKG